MNFITSKISQAKVLYEFKKSTLSQTPRVAQELVAEKAKFCFKTSQILNFTK